MGGLKNCYLVNIFASNKQMLVLEFDDLFSLKDICISNCSCKSSRRTKTDAVDNCLDCFVNQDGFLHPNSNNLEKREECEKICPNSIDLCTRVNSSPVTSQFFPGYAAVFENHSLGCPPPLRRRKKRPPSTNVHLSFNIPNKLRHKPE